jgi:hypothetical protein
MSRKKSIKQIKKGHIRRQDAESEKMRKNGPFISVTEPRRPFKKIETKCELIKTNDTFFVSKVFLLNVIHEIGKPKMKTILNF